GDGLRDPGCCLSPRCCARSTRGWCHRVDSRGYRGGRAGCGAGVGHQPRPLSSDLRGTLLSFPYGSGLSAHLQRVIGRLVRACGRLNTGGKEREMPLQRFIFDLDGVLTDTTEYHHQTWQRLAVEAAKVAGMYAVGLGPVERVG